ncbi:MAG: DUF4384 domain-containing protein [Syntrophales bacterium LBB04]|nr:DUF4384 domain-containing protein [Syntrophales bacterium LBB04]
MVEGLVSMEKLAREEARKLAIEEATRKAVQEAVGVDILSETLVINFKVGADIIKALPYGKVLDKEIIEEGTQEIRKEGKDIPLLSYRIKMKAKVLVEEGKVDPSFNITAGLNRNFFKEGEEIEIRASATKDCYLNIFNLLEDERVLILIPNHSRRENFVKANEMFSFPNEADKGKGLKLRIHGIEGTKSIRETIYLLALQQPLKFNADKYREGIYANYNGKTAFIKDLIREVIEIPPAERAEKFIQYQVLR